jgi:hypothetical protein
LAANIVRSATKIGNQWLTVHARTVHGKTVLKANGDKWTLPHAHLAPHNTTAA